MLEKVCEAQYLKEGQNALFQPFNDGQSGNFVPLKKNLGEQIGI